MPMHAAEIYHGTSPVCMSEFFVSSLGALVDAHKRPPLDPTKLKVLAVIQPSPGWSWPRLPEVRNELRQILDVVPEENLIALNADEADLESIHTTVQKVISRLPEANMLHLACHGTQDVADPLRSGFILADGERLTVEELTKLRLPSANTAILSACHTASNDAHQPEDSINLASAMLFLGFWSDLATKWLVLPVSMRHIVLSVLSRPMYDSDGPVFVKAMYRAFLAGESDITTRPAKASKLELLNYLEGACRSIRPL